MIGFPMDPNQPKPVTTAEVKAAAERARESGDWSEVAEMQRRPRLISREELDAMMDAGPPDKMPDRPGWGFGQRPIPRTGLPDDGPS